MSSERLWRWAQAARVGYLDYRASNPWRVSATTTWPRAILQCFFFVILDTASGGPGRGFAFEGAVALILTIPASVQIASVPSTDKWMGTFYQIRLGRMPVAGVMALRAIPWLLEAMIMLVLSTLAVGAVTGQLPLAFRLLTLAPVFLLMAVTNAAAGLAVGSFAVGRNADVLLGNALMYLIIATGGVVVPVGRLPWLDDVGRFLPVRNGLLAVRAIIAGRPWGTHLLLELAVGAAWAALAVAGFSFQVSRARRKGADAYA